MSTHPLDAFLERLYWRRFVESDIADAPTRVRLICYNPQSDDSTPQLTSVDVTVRHAEGDLAIGVQQRNLYPFLQTLLVRSSGLRTSVTVFGLRPCSCSNPTNGYAQWSPYCVPLLHHPSMNDVVNFAWLADTFRQIVTLDHSWQCNNPSHLIG
jgi:hypothetical protein